MLNRVFPHALSHAPAPLVSVLAIPARLDHLAVHSLPFPKAANIPLVCAYLPRERIRSRSIHGFDVAIEEARER